MDHSTSEYLRTWYSANVDQTSCRNYASPVADQAFRDARDRLPSEVITDAEKFDLARGLTKMQEVQTLISDSLNKYSDKRKHPNLWKWLQRAVVKIHHYSNIFDIFLQHHPAYVALAWGAMKLVIVSAQKHESMITLFSKALSKIGELLPRVDLATILYPTDRMRRAVGNLYANLLRFFIRAHEWACQTPLRHLLHSITRPLELDYKDLLEDIDGDSREIDRLAASGAYAEMREIRLTLTKISAKLDSFHALHSSALVDTNQRLSDLQLGQVMSHITVGKLGDPLRTFRFNQSLQRRNSRGMNLKKTNKFWQSQKLADWPSNSKSKTVVLAGGFHARFAMRGFSVDIIRNLQSNNVPILWALPGPKDDLEASGVSAIESLKHLTYQALQLNGNAATERGIAIQCKRFHAATTEQEWLQLLGDALLRAHSQVYLVIDLSILDQSFRREDDFQWLTGFQTLFTEVAKKSADLRIKVLLLCDGTAPWAQNFGNDSANNLVRVRTTQVPAHQRKLIDPAMRGRQSYGGTFSI